MRHGDEAPRVLLVDPSPPLCEMLADAIIDRGVAVVTARSGSEGVELLESADPDGLPDLVVANLRIDDMDGWELEETLDQDPRLQEIPVLLYSTAAEEQDAAGVYALREVPGAVEDALELARGLRDTADREGP